MSNQLRGKCAIVTGAGRGIGKAIAEAYGHAGASVGCLARTRAAVDVLAVIRTAPGEDCDFVSRIFAPGVGMPEDPVTGSAHYTLIPYWADRLGKRDMFARQISWRGGKIYCEYKGERVRIGGEAAIYLRGTTTL